MANLETMKVSMTKSDVLGETKDKDRWSNGATVILMLESLKKKENERRKEAGRGEVPPGTMSLAFNARFTVLNPQTREPMRPSIFTNVALPLRHPEHDVEPPGWATGSGSDWNQIVRALLADEGYAEPVRDGDHYVYQGKNIPLDQFDAAKLDLANRTAELLSQLWNQDINALNRRICIGRIKWSDTWTNPSAFRPLTDAAMESLTPLDQLRGEDLTGGGNGSTGAAQPAATKPAKGKGKK